MATSTSPQIVDESTPLDVLTLRALRRYGEMSPSTMDAETMLMFMDYANSVIDDLMEHPYWTKGVSVPYFTHTTQTRPVPDTVLLAGLISKYAIDQDSKKANVYNTDYLKRLNQVMARTKFGVGAEFSMQAVDNGTTDGGVS